MDPWFQVKKKDVIALLDKRKGRVAKSTLMKTSPPEPPKSEPHPVKRTMK